MQSDWLEEGRGKLALVFCGGKDIGIRQLVFIGIDEYDFLSFADGLLEADLAVLVAEEVKPRTVLAE